MSERIKCFMIEPVDPPIAGDDDSGTVAYRQWKRVDTGEIKQNIADFGPGAMYYADWLQVEAHTKWARKENGVDVEIPHPWGVGPDGKVLLVVTPGGSWNIDSRASNCGKPIDNVHRCWVRHGTPPEITVDKNGDTCSAGAGSIQCGSYHGFLRNGFLES